MFNKLLKKLGGSPAPDPRREVADVVNAMSAETVQSEVERLFTFANLWEVRSNPSGSPAVPQEIGALNSTFFQKFVEVRAQFMPLEFAWLGRPDWLPKHIDADLQIVGHTAEQEFLFCRPETGTVFELALDDPDHPGQVELNSVYHAAIFYFRVYGPR